ncbi:hypothetical protein SpCBS45565_g05361 [Spizellomyces sp. 'palustris']|nr:hypothetical protein SpCBS45565_g05361 [Spizellomyces sp. 'palustris']
MPDPYWPQRRIGLDEHVWYGTCKATGQQVVLKLFDRERFAEGPVRDEKVLAEVKILKDLCRAHPKRIIGFVDFYANDEDQLVLVMERAACTLQDALYDRKVLSELDAREAIFGMLEAVYCVHSAQLVHRDIKPANLMLMEKNNFSSLKLADFGATVGNVGYDNLNQIAGTMGYEAPEMLSRTFYGKSVDLWSCGVVAYQLLFGVLPFKPVPSSGFFATKKIGPKQQLDAIRKGLEFPHDIHVSDLAKDFVRSLLQMEPSRRPSIQKALEHPWFGHGGPESTMDAPDLDMEPLAECPGWMIVTQEDGTVYYYNKDTQKTTWDPPVSGPPPRLPGRPSDKMGLADVADQLMRKEGHSVVDGEKNDSPMVSTTKSVEIEDDESGDWKPGVDDTPVPDYPDWYPLKTEDGEVYYYNIKTKDTIWEHPSKLEKQRRKERRDKVRAEKDVRDPGKKEKKRVQFGNVVTEIVTKQQAVKEPVNEGNEHVSGHLGWKEAARQVAASPQATASPDAIRTESPPIPPRPVPPTSSVSFLGQTASTAKLSVPVIHRRTSSFDRQHTAPAAEPTPESPSRRSRPVSDANTHGNTNGSSRADMWRSGLHKDKKEGGSVRALAAIFDSPS